MIKYCELCVDHGLASLPYISQNIKTISEYIVGGCDFFDVEINEVVGRKRTRTFTEPRHMVMAYLCSYHKFSLAQIGRAFFRDHTTVINAREKVSNLCMTYKDYKREYLLLVDHLNNLQ